MHAIGGVLQGYFGTRSRPGAAAAAAPRAAARLVPLTPAMNAILFGLKRAWHGSLRVTRQALASMGLTAARFDLLHAVSERGTNTITQSELRRRLGVNRATVSRMLRSLEDLGLVLREPCYSDRRTLRVSLSDEGRHRIQIAQEQGIGTGAAQLAVDSAVAGFPPGAPGAGWHDDEACFQTTCVLDSLLDGLRHTYRDFATLHYPWHPDD